MSKKAKHEEHADESWLIPYADVLTLLLALFIVLFSSSSLDLEKYEKIMGAFASEFSSSSSGGGSDGVGAGDGAGGEFLPEDLEALLKEQSGAGADGGSGSDGNGGEGEGEGSPLEQLHGAFEGWINDNAMGDEIQVKITGESLLMTLTSDIWFPSGSATITPSQRDTARKIADMIQSQLDANPGEPFSIVITGHTDNVPIKTAQFPSNWYLSATRAINFMEAMLSGADLDPRMFSARGYGEYEPIEDNDTTEHRQQNRRVEVLISLDNYANASGAAQENAATPAAQPPTPTATTEPAHATTEPAHATTEQTPATTEPAHATTDAADAEAAAEQTQ